MCDILIVDDDYAIRDMLQEALEDAGYRVMSAEHGKQALDQLRRAQPLPRLILLDLMMPVMSGWEFRMAQQSDQRLAAIPVIVLSARSSMDHDTYAMSADGFINKPLNIDRLLDVVERYCHQRHM
jgi:CheY-like chemotaxis protein